MKAAEQVGFFAEPACIAIYVTYDPRFRAPAPDPGDCDSVCVQVSSSHDSKPGSQVKILHVLIVTQR